ncbi:MAG TPA: PKD domain-containing protein [Candidatus Dormibacteraeota bacterium]|nr:PKD domain-containing protein [Candidatus Dormibacteraeota bacterium]
MLEQRRLRILVFILGLMAGALIQSVILPEQARAATASPDVALSTAVASRAQGVSPPMIDAPAAASGIADQALSIEASATDPDFGDVLTITVTGVPPSLTLTTSPAPSTATATLAGTLTGADVGPWSIVWSVDDGSGGNATTTTQLTVGPNHDPVVSSPATVNGAEGVAMAFAVTASDPDGDPITLFTAGSLPAGASFTPNAFKTVGELAWMPAVGQQGSYTVTFSVASGSPARTATATTVINIAPPDRPPVISSPGTVTGRANHLVTFTATASDPDGDAITLFQANGTQNTALPPGSVWTVNASNTSGTFTWTPTQDQVANYGIDLVAYSGSVGLRAIKVTRINVLADRAPVITVPATITVAEGTPLSVTLTATDPEGDAIASLTATGLPLGATFSSGVGNTTGRLDWTPGFQDAGTYPVTFIARNLLTGTATTAITVSNANRAPVANPGGPYTGIAGIPVTFNGTMSSDPDGDPLAYAWDFGDGGTGNGMTPGHAYASQGTFTVSLTVADNGTPALSNTQSTTATIADKVAANVFQSNTAPIKLNKPKDKSKTCFQVEPVSGSYSNSDVVLSSVVLQYQGREAHANIDRTIVNLDWNLNGVPEIRVCFTDQSLRTLFAGIPAGDNTVTVAIEGNLATGGRFHGENQVVVRGPVSGSSGVIAAAVSPNPLNPAGTLLFTTTRPGNVKVDLFDLQGRLVRTLQTATYMDAGVHETRIVSGESGAPLSSGVYFYRIQAPGESVTGRFSVLK